MTYAEILSIPSHPAVHRLEISTGEQMPRLYLRPLTRFERRCIRGRTTLRGLEFLELTRAGNMRRQVGTLLEPSPAQHLYYAKQALSASIRLRLRREATFGWHRLTEAA